MAAEGIDGPTPDSYLRSGKDASLERVGRKLALLGKVTSYLIGLERAEQLVGGVIRRLTRWRMKQVLMEQDDKDGDLKGEDRETKSREIIGQIENNDTLVVGRIIEAVKKVRGYRSLSRDGVIVLLNALRVGNDISISELEPQQMIDGTGDKHGSSM